MCDKHGRNIYQREMYSFFFFLREYGNIISKPLQSRKELRCKNVPYNIIYNGKKVLLSDHVNCVLRGF